MSFAFKDLHWTKQIPIKDYFRPHTLAEALDILTKYSERAIVVAGGTDVIPQLRRRELNVEALVDVTRIPELKSIEEKGSQIVLGALATHTSIASSPLLKEKAELLSEGAKHVGSPQIRNIGTVGGNLVSGQPAADTSIPLLALNASVTLVSRETERVVPLTSFFLDTGKTAIERHKEILTHIKFNVLTEHHGCCYLRLSQRKALALPILVGGIVVKVQKQKRIIEEAAIALGPVSPIPIRIRRVEEQLCGNPISKETIEAACEIALEECYPRDSLLRGSSRYRKEMVKVFVKRGLQKALAQAGCPVTQ